jgi:hypothetical protein
VPSAEKEKWDLKKEITKIKNIYKKNKQKK